MRETEKRIKEYQKALPHLKEKVAAAGLMLLISAVTMTASTFAWVTLSQSPEVSGMTTTLAGNGNLEIALSDIDGMEPEESEVGDSGKDIRAKNITWGNLIELADPSYGMENIVLRPAALNLSSLDESPLFSATYAQDGRVEDLTSNFAYSNYNKELGFFEVPEKTQYGVRAVSSVTYKFTGVDPVFVERLDAAGNRLARAKAEYEGLCGNSDNMNAIASVMGTYLTDRYDDSETVYDYGDYIPAIHNMMSDFNSSMDLAGDAILNIANLQIMLEKGDSVEPYKDIDTLLADSANWAAKGVSIGGLSLYASDRASARNFMKQLDEIIAQDNIEVPWSKLDPIFSYLVVMNTTTIDGIAFSNFGMSEALPYVMNKNKIANAVITEGALVRMEDRLGTYMYVPQLKIHAKAMGMEADVKANITTCAGTANAETGRPYNYLQKSIDAVKNSDSDGLMQTAAAAADTYGLAVDFWVRSNAAEDYLILEGNTKINRIEKVDDQGYKYFINEDGVTVLGKENDKGEMQYYLEDGSTYTLAEEETLAIVYDEIVAGYEGVNRVWDSLDPSGDASSAIKNYSATQGGGSCFVFYGDTPQDQAQVLELMRAMTVVFIDEDGALLAYADMDVDAHYAESGRVTIPMKLRSTSINIGEDEDGKAIYAITELEQNVAKRITALFYVNGVNLMNSEVLADQDIQGQFNIQFGSAANLEAMMDNKVYDSEIHITASADKTSFDAETGEELKSVVTVNISGLEPKNVKANFVRQINSTQGTREEAITFVSSENGTWTSEVEFTSPGEYILRSVWLDGVEYDLDSPLTIMIDGFSVNSVSWSHADNMVKIMSADSSVTETINVTFGGLAPRSVQGIFSNENNQQITFSFTKGTTSWAGTTKFTTSGIYKLQYLIIDEEYYEIPPAMQKTLSLALGMNTRVAISETSWTYEGEAKTVQVYATVADNTGEELTELENVSIQYLAQGSSLVENGLYSKMTWNADEKCYEGSFDVKNAGAYEFGYLSIGTSSIHSAKAPVITAIPPVPPSYTGNLTDTSIFAYGSDVYMRIIMQDSGAVANGNAVAVLHKLKEDGKPETDADNNAVEILVGGTKTVHSYTQEEDSAIAYQDWLFKIPTTDELTNAGYSFSQLGSWDMTELRIIGAYVDGEISTEEEPYVIDLSSENIKTTVNDEMTVVVKGDGASATSLFMEPGVVNEGLVVEIRGAGGESVEKVHDVVVTYALDYDDTSIYSTGTDSEGYSSENLDTLTTYGRITAKLAQNVSDSKQFMLTGTEAAMTLPLAGTYDIKNVSYIVGGTEKDDGTWTGGKSYTVEADKFSADSESPTFRMEWIAPVVKIKEVNPLKVKAHLSNSGNSTTDTNNEITDDYNCTVYMNVEKTSDGVCGIGGSVTEYSQSSVTTELSNIGSFHSAQLTVDGDPADTVFEYSASSYQSTKPIGSSDGRSRSRLGEGKGTHITVTGIMGNNAEITYNFALDNQITINNPY